jgi:hypothetical protein
VYVQFVCFENKTKQKAPEIVLPLWRSSNALLEEHRDPTHGDVCRLPDGGLYCPVGCEHVSGKPHCTANSGHLEAPCR